MRQSHVCETESSDKGMASADRLSKSCPCVYVRGCFHAVCCYSVVVLLALLKIMSPCQSDNLMKLYISDPTFASLCRQNMIVCDRRLA